MADTDLVKAFKVFFRVFYNYAMLEEPRDKLSRAEFSQVVMEQLLNSPQTSGTRKANDRLFKELDQNEDTELSFKEFTTFICKLLNDIHHEFHQDP